MELLAIYKKWFKRLLLISLGFLVFQSSIVSVSANPVILDQSHHTGVSEIYTYDGIESLIGVERDRTGGLSRVLSIKEVRPDYKVLVKVESVAAKVDGLTWSPFAKKIGTLFQIFIQTYFFQKVMLTREKV